MRALLALLALAALLVAAAPAPARTAPARLSAFDSCAQLTRFARAHAGLARRAVGPAAPARTVAALAPGWRQTPGPPAGATPEAVPTVPSPAAPAAAAGPAAAGGPDTSATNLQEAGVDEPDVAKLDTTHLFVAAGDALQVVDTRPDAPVLVATLPVPGGAGELLVHDDTVLVLARTATGTRVTEVDVADRAAPRIARVQDVDGAYVTARLTGATARIVTTHRPSVLNRPAAAARRATAAQCCPGPASPAGAPAGARSASRRRAATSATRPGSSPGSSRPPC
jgi:uncharacterized secreted protein with C-terminal beta-propeller domain